MAMEILVPVGILIVLIIIGVPIGICLLMSSFIGLWMATGTVARSLGLLGVTAYGGIAEYTYTVIPMFVLMGVIVEVSGMGKELYDAAKVLMGRIRGGLGIATIAANTVFSAVSGASTASAALFTKISLPELEKAGYDRRMSFGIVAGSSALGMIIPPSVLMIIYGVLAQVSVGRLFIAGIIPGLLIAAAFSLATYIWCTVRPEAGGRQTNQVVEKLSFKSKLVVIASSWVIVVLIVVVLGGIYAGVLTPTEAGAAGAAVALILALIKRRLTLSSFWRSLVETGLTSTGILFLLMTATMFARMLGTTGAISSLSGWILGMDVSNTVILGFFILVLLFAGLFLDAGSTILLTMPLMLPIARLMGFDLVWFGLIAIIAAEIGMYTPPFGIVVYTMASVLEGRATIQEIFVGSLPYAGVMLICLIILILFPAITLWLPSTM